MEQSGGQDIGHKIDPEPAGPSPDAPGQRFQTLHNPFIFFSAALFGLLLAACKTIARAIGANVWTIVGLLILSAVGGYFLNTYLEKNDSVYIASGVVQIPQRRSADPLHPAPPQDENELAMQVQSVVARFHDENLIDDLLKDPSGLVRQTNWWKLTCAQDPGTAREMLVANLDVSPMPGSNLMRISFSASDKSDAVVMVTAVVDQTISAERELIRDIYDAQRRQTAEYKDRYSIALRNAQADVAAMMSELCQISGGGNPETGLGGAKQAELAARVNERIQLQSQKVDADSADAALKEMRERGQIPPEVNRMVSRDPEIIEAAQKLNDLDTRLGDARETATTQSDDPQRIIKQQVRWQHKLDDLKAEKLAEYSDAYTLQIAQTKSAVDSKLDHCTSEIARLEVALADVANKEMVFKSREEDLRADRELVMEYSQHLQSIDQQIRNNNDLGGIAWFARPKPPTERSFPRLANIMTLAVLCGLVLGLCIAFVRELVKWGRDGQTKRQIKSETERPAAVAG
jgi:uncharacterized protein involved in exopolysaccharide biosynthesis